MVVADTAEGFAMLIGLLALYFLPTILAFGRHVSSPWSVAVINVFLGWTLVGWVVALAMSAREPVNAKTGAPTDTEVSRVPPS